jgi:hypothetical protein
MEARRQGAGVFGFVQDDAPAGFPVRARLVAAYDTKMV